MMAVDLSHYRIAEPTDGVFVYALTEEGHENTGERPTGSAGNASRTTRSPSCPSSMTSGTATPATCSRAWNGNTVPSS